MSTGAVLASSAATTVVGGWTQSPAPPHQIGSCSLPSASCYGRAAVLLEGPQCRADPSLAFCGKVLLVGSSNSSDAKSDHNAADLYDPRHNTWSNAGPTLQSRTNPKAVQIDGPACAANPTRGACGKVLVVGGSNDIPDTAELYDPATKAWTPAAGLLYQHIHFFTMVLLQGPRCGSLCGKVLVAGGEGVPGQPGASEVYDPLSGGWTKTGALHTPRAEHVSALLDGPACAGSSAPAYCGDVLVAGGFTPSSSGVSTETAELFDPAATDATTGLPGAWGPTGSLKPGASLPYAPGLATAAVLTGPRCGAHCGQVIIAGGVGEQFSPVPFIAQYRTAELYDPTAGTWTATALLSDPRSDHAGILLPNGEYLVAGGQGVSGTLNTAELYDPGASIATWTAAPPMPVSGFAFATTVLSAGPASTCGELCGRALVTGGNMTVAELFEGLPAVGSVAPDPVPLAGASTVVTGGGFTTATQVTIDGVPVPCPYATCATDPTSPDTTLDVTFPSHAAGTVTLVVHNKIGDSPPFLVRYADPLPTLAALSPGCGPVAGGTTVVISGTNFTPAATVDVAGTGVPATVLSSTTVRFTSPSASTAGGVPVTVTTSGGTSSPLTFTYPCALAAAAGAPAAAGFVPTSAQTGAQPPAYPQPPPAAQVPPATAATVATAASHGPVAAAGQSVGGIAGVGADDPAGVPALRYGMARHEDWSVSPPLVAAGAAMLGAFGFCLFTGASPAARIRRRSAITPAPAPARTEEITR